MNRKILHRLLIIGLIIGLVLVGGVTRVRADNFEELKNYFTGDNIYLKGKPIVLPKNIASKNEEFRGVWVSSIYNLDFPSKKGLSKDQYKKEYLELLNQVEKLNLNSIIFQVRPKGDAFYKSDINPWSENLSGKEGLSPGWDPLEWMIKVTHERGLEFHAWFNPYRVTERQDLKLSKQDQLKKLSGGNWARKNPDHVFLYKGKLYLNPGSPKVIDYVNNTIMEVVYKYDIDGVHLDDYFYPNKSIKDGENFYSKEENIFYSNRLEKDMNVSNWRRDNVNRLIEKISISINNYNKNNNEKVQFGVSPFGIWGHKLNHPESSEEGVGSNTPIGSQSSYDNQFADSRKWVKEGWVDYIVPQIYWTFDEKAAPYGELVDWWADVVRGTDVDLYIGHGLYKNNKSNEKSSWVNPREISNQLRFNSLYKEIKGSVYFRYKNLLTSTDIINNRAINILKEDHYKYKVKLPSLKNITSKKVKEPYDLQVNSSLEGNILTWKDYKDNSSSYYIIYRKEKASKNNKEIVGRLDRKEKENFLVYLDREVDPSKKYEYFVSAVNKNHKESKDRYKK